MKPTCATCMHFAANQGDVRQGWCVIRSVPGDFPARWKDQRCGEHEPEARDDEGEEASERR